MKTLDDTVEMLRIVGDYLVPYNVPKASRFDEAMVSPLKRSVVEVDGYTVGVVYNRSDRGEYYLESVQIYGESSPFLPFIVVIKVARRFLGNKITYIEMPREDKQFYCWACYVDKNGKPMDSQFRKHTEKVVYEDFRYELMPMSEFNLY